MKKAIVLCLFVSLLILSFTSCVTNASIDEKISEGLQQYQQEVVDIRIAALQKQIAELEHANTANVELAQKDKRELLASFASIEKLIGEVQQAIGELRQEGEYELTLLYVEADRVLAEFSKEINTLKMDMDNIASETYEFALMYEKEFDRKIENAMKGVEEVHAIYRDMVELIYDMLARYLVY